VPSLPEDERSTVDGLRRLTDELNEHAAALTARDIRLGYHNHASEFAPLGQTTAWNVLLADLAPEIEIELDVYWASVGGRDPVTEIRRTADRVRLLHLKDRAPGTEHHDAPAGEGTLDLAAIVTAGEEAGVEWFIAEQDDPADELADITTAYRNLAVLAS
jgi:sugar phosphate isomerase/epimerase